MPYFGENNIRVGDRIITCNSHLGTVVRLNRDDLGDYLIVKLDRFDWEFAYDPWDLKKVTNNESLF